MAKVALLIGVSEYEAGLNSLPSTVMDVDAMQRVLQHPDMGDFAPSDITVLKNPQRQTMEEAIETLFFNRQKDDLVLLYFSGHGIKDDSGRLFLATRQTRKNTKGELVRTTAVAASLIHDIMENRGSRRQVIILDCCFSGAFAEGMRAKDDGSLDIKNQLAETKKPQSVEGRAVLTSSTATQFSFEQEGSDLSVYTRYLVEGIEKGAADTNDDGFISVDELHEYARKKVQEAAPAMKPEIYAIKEGYKIQLAKSAKDDPRLLYRKMVEDLAHQGTFSIPGRKRLNNLRLKLKLIQADAEAIEVEVLQPYRDYQRKLQEYQQTLIDAVQAESPLSDRTLKDLRDYQQDLGLREEDVKPIQEKILPQPITDTPPPTTDEDDLSSEKGIDYTKLRDLLAAGKWKEADYETYLVMLKAVGRKENDYIRPEELLNFPCADLRTIDQLWVKYSNGRFGFSVQKNIYMWPGKPYDSHDEKAWEKLGDRMGFEWVNVEPGWVNWKDDSYGRKIINFDEELDIPF